MASILFQRSTKKIFKIENENLCNHRMVQIFDTIQEIIDSIIPFITPKLDKFFAQKKLEHETQSRCQK
jgi:hypothetical protein